MIDADEIIASTGYVKGIPRIGDRTYPDRLNIAIRQIVAKFNAEIERIEAENVELERRLERIEDDYQRKPSEGYRFTIEEG